MYARSIARFIGYVHHWNNDLSRERTLRDVYQDNN